MSKTLVVALALSLVLVSGGMFSAQADCGCLNPCGWHLPSLCNINWNPCGWHLPSCFSCSQRNADRDKAAPNNNMDTGKY